MSKIILILPPQNIYLKTGCNIPIKTGESTPVHLILELGDFGLSVMWFTKNPISIKGLSVYIFEDEDDYVENIKSIFKSSNIESTNPASIQICYNYKESMLVPDKYYQSELNDHMLSLLNGDSDDTFIKDDHIENFAIHNIYRIPQNIYSLIQHQFPNASAIHSSSLQIQQKKEGHFLYCVVFYDAIKVILYVDGLLNLVQQFKYSSPEDVAYHLLNTCQQHDMKPSEIKLRLYGMIVKDSNLYQQLHNYFLDIDFITIPEEINVRQEINDLPAHFFSHLTELATCVL